MFILMYMSCLFQYFVLVLMTCNNCVCRCKILKMCLVLCLIFELYALHALTTCMMLYVMAVLLIFPFCFAVYCSCFVIVC